MDAASRPIATAVLPLAQDGSALFNSRRASKTPLMPFSRKPTASEFSSISYGGEGEIGPSLNEPQTVELSRCMSYVQASRQRRGW